MNVIVAWSGGKDSALALYMVLTRCRYNVLGLLTAFTEDYDRLLCMVLDVAWFWIKLKL